MQKLVRSTQARVSGFQAALLGACAFVASGLAAAATPTGFDESAVTSAITENQGKAVIIIGVFLVAVWVLRSMGLLGKR